VVSATSSSSPSEELNAGAAYVYTRQGNVWVEQSKVKPSLNEWNQSFGAAVALSGNGNTLAVGTPKDRSQSSGVNSDPLNYFLGFEVLYSYSSYYRTWIPYLSPLENNSTPVGATYVFTKSGNNWIQEAYIKASNSSPDLLFGGSLALSYTGDTLVVGSLTEPSRAVGINGDQLDRSASNAGAAYLYIRNGNNWMQKSYVKSPNSDINDRFARAVGLDWLGETLVVGAHRESSKAKGVNAGEQSDNTASASGAVYLY
jgi:hypothetical protein